MHTNFICFSLARKIELYFGIFDTFYIIYMLILHSHSCVAKFNTDSIEKMLSSHKRVIPEFF